MGSQKRKKDKAFDVGPLAGPQQIELSIPIGVVNTDRICWPAGGRIDHGIHTIQGVIETVWLQKIAAGQLTTPLLKK